MNTAGDRQKINCASGYVNLFIFAAFIAGLILYPRLRLRLSFEGLGYKTGIIICCMLPVFSFLSASSIFGPVILPVCAFTFGAISYMAAERCIIESCADKTNAISYLITALIIFPVFFTIAVQGMGTSKILISSLCSRGLSAKDDFKRKYIPMIFGLCLWAMTVYYIIG